MINIAIDGPSGAGKSTVAKAIAAKLKIVYLDTGAMYRAMAWIALSRGVSPLDEAEVVKMLPDANISIEYVAGEQKVFAGDIDVSKAIREHHMSKAASDISKIPAVRLKLVDMQRKIARGTDIVMDGRDTTSYVLPDAKFKFFLTASPEERARRRQAELKEKGMEIEFGQLLKDILDRDKNDSERAFAPLTRTPDSVYIDSTGMTKDEVINKIISYIK